MIRVSPDQAMELTGTRPVFTFQMTKSLSLRVSLEVAHLFLVRR